MSDEYEAKSFASIDGFEWDDNKRRSNIAKHGIDFADAIEVFSDPSQYTYRSPQELDEVRYISVGIARGVLMAVVFVKRNNRIRIISARTARRNEREFYG
jgi:uncharacterized DUF497 family protein